MSEIIILGAGGHAKVLADLVVKTGHTLLGFLDDTSGHPPVLGFPILGRIEEAGRFSDRAQFLIGIGSNAVRKRFDGELPVRWATLVHPSAAVGLGAEIGEGTVLLAGASSTPAPRSEGTASSTPARWLNTTAASGTTSTSRPMPPSAAPSQLGRAPTSGRVRWCATI